MFEVEPVIFTLSNGIRVVYHHADAYVAHMGVMIHAGSRFEKPHEEGLAHFIEHCIFKGTKKRKAFDIFTDLDSVGGELNAYTNKEEICVHASFRKAHFSIASELLGDIIQNATFPIDEITKEKGVVLDEINSYLDNPVECLFDQFEEELFKSHPLGANILGSIKTVNSFDREMLRDYVSRLFVAKNIVISFVGGISIEKLKNQLEEDFSNVSTAELNGGYTTPPHLSNFYTSSKKSNFQTHTILGGYAPSYNNDDRKGMTLLTNYLGGPALNSRLVLSIREKYGYAYSVEASYSPYSDIGFWSIYTGTEPKNLQKAIKLIHEELDEVCSTKIDEKQLEQAKEQLKGHIALSLDSNLEVMFNLAKSVLIFNKVDNMSEIKSQIDVITNIEIQSIAQKVFAPDNISELIYNLKN